MQHPFVALEPEYTRLLASVRITRLHVVEAAVDEIIKGIDRYKGAAELSTVPAAWIGPTDCRESDCNPWGGLGQGDDWRHVSRHVPAGCGPFKSWADAAQFYLKYDHINVISVPAWSPAYMCFKWEGWNGFGPRAHGRLSGYLWSCTQWYDPPKDGGEGDGGKYVADGEWSGSTVDTQPGCVPIYMRLTTRYPDLIVPGWPAGPATAATTTVIPPPIGVGHDQPEWIQNALNKAGADPQLVVDGNFGRRTRWAVRQFQEKRGLVVDGLVGPETMAALEPFGQ